VGAMLTTRASIATSTSSQIGDRWSTLSFVDMPSERLKPSLA